MKKIIKSFLFVSVFCAVSLISSGQEKQSRLPRWISENGYWVIESYINQPLNHVIRFYNNDNVMIYKETLKGVKLNPEKRKVRMKLKKALEASVVAWGREKKPSEEMAYIRSILN